MYKYLKTKFIIRIINSQHIAEDTQGPHVSGERDGLKVDDLRGTELCRAEENLDLLPFLKALGKAKVDDLDVVAVFVHAHHILWL